MRAAILALAMATIAAPGVAQELVYDFGPTETCLSEAEGAELYDCAWRAASACMENTEGGYATVGTVACLDAEYRDWDARLNRSYRALMAELEAQDADTAASGLPAPSQAEALREMQRAWIAFRDATCTFRASRWTGGTGAGPAYAGCLLDETAEQVLELEVELGW